MYKIDDPVIVTTPHGEFPGVVFAILPNYAWSDETRYEIHGKNILTICREGSIKRLTTNF